MHTIFSIKNLPDAIVIAMPKTEYYDAIVRLAQILRFEAPDVEPHERDASMPTDHVSSFQGSNGSIVAIFGSGRFFLVMRADDETELRAFLANECEIFV